MTVTRPYPALPRPLPVATLWAGARLADWIGLPSGRPRNVGENWLVSDSNVVDNGPLAGLTLGEVVARQGEAFVGTRAAHRHGGILPLLAKFIDAAAPLSVQVHPDDMYAAAREAGSGWLGKTEAWYVVEAPPDATIVCGLWPVARDVLVSAVETGSLQPLLRRLPVAAGDTILLPAGTVHAVGAGILLFEIGQKSDLTYRIDDYGRVDPRTGRARELHLTKALDVIDVDARPLCPEPVRLTPGRELLVACPQFALERWTPTGAEIGQTDPATFEILTNIGGPVALEWDGEAVMLGSGASAVLPASLGEYAVLPMSGVSRTGSTILRAHVPDLAADIVAPLRARGAGDERIAQLVQA